jgi:hypothetical protein
LQPFYKTLLTTACALACAVSTASYGAGAIAVDDEAGDHPDDVGYGIGFGKSRDAAGVEAMKACRKDGNKNCVLKVRFDGCGAYAASKRYYGVGWGKTVKEAERKAIEACARSSCEVVVSDCDE